MKLGDIVIVAFLFTNLLETKIRPAVVTVTGDKYKDVVISLISSVLPTRLTKSEIILHPDNLTNLRTVSVIKTYRLAAVQQEKIISKTGRLSAKELQDFITAFQSLVAQA